MILMPRIIHLVLSVSILRHTVALHSNMHSNSIVQHHGFIIASVGSGTSGQASHEDAKAVHSLLKDTFQDAEASVQWFDQCQKVFCWSQYFDGSKRLQIQPGPDSNGAVKDGVAHLSLNGHKQ